jgi:hypothetical protein
MRSLVLLWLATWVLADPLCLLQALMAPQDDSAAYRFVQQGPVGAHVTQHHSDALVASSTEGNPNRVDETQSDELGPNDRVDLSRFDHALSVALTVALPSCFLCSTSAVPRAPPSA